MKRSLTHGRHTFDADTVYRALHHHAERGRVTFLRKPGHVAGHPTKFQIRLAGSYDFDILEYTVREAYMLNLGLVTMEKMQQAAEATS